METIFCDSYDALSEMVAAEVARLASASPKPLICPASGDTPAGLYRELVKQSGERRVDISEWRFVGLDEWVGLNGEDEGSCRYSINAELFRPLDVQPSRIFFFDGKAQNLENECRMAEAFIKTHNGIDVAILGLGMNGHIAMNEPGCEPHGRAMVVPLHPVTKEVGQKYFSRPRELNEGITLGMGTLMESKHIILMVSGEHKAPIVKRLLEGPVTNELPGSLLLGHPTVKIFLDAGAASQLSKNT